MSDNAARPGLKFGITLGLAHPASWPELTRRADELGFDSVWLPEHLVLPTYMAGSPHDGTDHPPIPPNIPVFDALAYLSFLAGQTSSIRLGTYVYNVGLRHPFVSARAATTLDVVSEGRFEFGVGASWLREEWDAAGLDFDTRGARVNEALDVCKRLWTEERVAHHGKFFDFDEVMFEPKPVQPGGPPITVGGDSRAALSRVVKYGDGWIPMNHTVEQLPPTLAKLHEMWSAAGRSGKPVVTMGTTIESRDDVERAHEAGVDRAIVTPWKRNRDAVNSLTDFAETYIRGS